MTAEGAHRHLRILHGVIVALLVAFGVVALVVTGGGSADAAAPSWTSMRLVLFALGGFSGVIFAMIPVIRGKMLPRVPPGYRAESEQARQRARAAIIRRWVSGNIFTWALCASVGVYGLVASVMMRQPWPYLLFAAPTALVLLWFRPRLEPLKELLSMINRK